MLHAKIQTQQLEKGGAEIDLEIDIMSSYPWNYQEKWPLTRTERLQRVGRPICPLYKTPKINAAKSWHSQFPEDQIIPCEQVSFKMERSSKSQIRLENSVVWDEVSNYSL